MLTQAQRRTYEFIKHYFSANGISPTSREIAEGINIQSRGVVYRYLRALQEQGYIELIPSKHRNILLKQSEKRSKSTLPMLGIIAAGKPIEAIEDLSEVDLHTIFPSEDVFALVVQGDSMIDEGILNGDIVICKKTSIATDGDIVVALVDGLNATLKRIHFDSREEITLIPSNKLLKPQTYQSNQITIQGKYIGLLRKKPI